MKTSCRAAGSVRRLACLLVVTTLGALVASSQVRGQGLWQEALAVFPSQTFRIEQSRLDTLRKLPSYNSLRQRYVSPRLLKLEESLTKLGVRESDLDVIILGWQPGAKEMDLFGYVSGKFDPKKVADSAATEGIQGMPVGDETAYCFEGGLEATCVALVDQGHGVFGTFNSLTLMLDSRAGRTAGQGAPDSLRQMVREAKVSSPIWGVAVGAAVPDWFRGSMPGQDKMNLDWSTAFQSVEALGYSVDPTDRVHLDVLMSCNSPEAAANLQRILDGVRVFQQSFWQQTHPNQPNPLSGLTVTASGKRIQLQATTDYTAVEGMATANQP